jgi:hypothetical protein
MPAGWPRLATRHKGRKHGGSLQLNGNVFNRLYTQAKIQEMRQDEKRRIRWVYHLLGGMATCCCDKMKSAAHHVASSTLRISFGTRRDEEIETKMKIGSNAISLHSQELVGARASHGEFHNSGERLYVEGILDRQKKKAEVGKHDAFAVRHT